MFYANVEIAYLYMQLREEIAQTEVMLSGEECCQRGKILRILGVECGHG
jgi:hypothetical protein